MVDKAFPHYAQFLKLYQSWQVSLLQKRRRWIWQPHLSTQYLCDTASHIPKRQVAYPFFIELYDTVIHYTKLYCTRRGVYTFLARWRRRHCRTPYRHVSLLGRFDNPMCNDSIIVYPILQRWMWFPSRYTNIHIKMKCMLLVYNAAPCYSILWYGMPCFATYINTCLKRIFKLRLMLY